MLLRSHFNSVESKPWRHSQCFSWWTKLALNPSSSLAHTPELVSSAEKLVTEKPCDVSESEMEQYALLCQWFLYFYILWKSLIPWSCGGKGMLQPLRSFWGLLPPAEFLHALVSPPALTAQCCLDSMSGKTHHFSNPTLNSELSSSHLLAETALNLPDPHLTSLKDDVENIL